MTRTRTKQRQGHRITGFSQTIAAELKSYVYRLVDPRNGETFYIGKGQGDRVFQHIRGAVREEVFENEGLLPGMMQRIRQIQNQHDLEAIHIIHRHGMSPATALAVEAALIDATPGLANLVRGHGSSKFGTKHVAEIVEMYEAEEADIRHRALLLNIGRSLQDRPGSRLDAARYAWRVDPSRAARAEVVLGVSVGMIRAVFVADRWLPATAKNFPGFPEASPGRHGFEGAEAPEQVASLYRDKRVPDKYTGTSNPVRYTYR